MMPVYNPVSDGTSRLEDTYAMTTRLVALRIMELCFVNNLTLSELASRSGMPINSIRDIISGKNRDMRLSSLVRIASGLNADLAYFFDTAVFETGASDGLTDIRPFPEP
jgi:transcriptional regulator with XRE-family HTH domain